MNAKLKAAALLGLVFLAGGVCGVAGTHLLQRHLLSRALSDPGFVARTLCRRMESQVGLTREQRQKCDAELIAARGRFIALHEEIHPRVMEIFAGSRDRLCAMLTPEQKPKFAALLRRWESAHDAIAPSFPAEMPHGSAPGHGGNDAVDGCGVKQ